MYFSARGGTRRNNHKTIGCSVRQPTGCSVLSDPLIPRVSSLHLLTLERDCILRLHQTHNSLKPPRTYEFWIPFWPFFRLARVSQRTDSLQRFLPALFRPQWFRIVCLCALPVGWLWCEARSLRLLLPCGTFSSVGLISFPCLVLYSQLTNTVSHWKPLVTISTTFSHTHTSLILCRPPFFLITEMLSCKYQSTLQNLPQLHV